jgi:hypothetical protein
MDRVGQDQGAGAGHGVLPGAWSCSGESSAAECPEMESWQAPSTLEESAGTPRGHYTDGHMIPPYAGVPRVGARFNCRTM